MITARTSSPGRHREDIDRERLGVIDVLTLGVPIVAVIASATTVVSRIVPPAGPPLDAVARYLPLLIAAPLLLRSRLSAIRFTLPVLGWGLAALVSSLIAPHPNGWSYSGAGAMLAIYIGPWLIASTSLTSSMAERLLKAFSLTPALLLGFAVLCDLAGIAPLLEVDGASGSLRLGGLMIAAAWATLGVGGALASAMRIALGHQIAWTLLAVSGLLVVLAQGRGAALALIAGSVPLLRLATQVHKRWAGQRYVLRAMALAVVLLLAMAAGWKVVSDRQEVLPVPVYLSDVVTQSDPTSGRGEAWTYFLDRWQEQPVFGHGPSSAYVLSQSAESELVRHHFKAAHNEYVQALVEFGLFGLVLISGSLAVETAIARRRARPELKPFPPAIIAAFAMFAMTDNATSPIFAIAIAMLLTISRSIEPDVGPMMKDPAQARPDRWRSDTGALP